MAKDSHLWLNIDQAIAAAMLYEVLKKALTVHTF